MKLIILKLNVKILLNGRTEETITSNDVTINMSNLNITYEKGATFKELNKTLPLHSL